MKKGDLVDIRVRCTAGEKATMVIKGAILDNELFRDGYDVLSASIWELTTFEETFVEGKILCDRDGLLYTSIPQNGNWHVMVDGASVEPVLVGDAMMAVMLTEGEHTVTFTYKNVTFSLGWKITLLCAVVFGATLLIYYPDLRRKLLKR